MTQKDGYYILGPGESQYDGLDLTKPLPARYVRAVNESQQGNILAEALPPRLTGDDTIRRYTRGITGFHWDDVKDMTRDEKANVIRRLRELRFAMPFDQDLEDGVADALQLSYSMRHLVDVTDPDTAYMTNGVTVHPKCITWAESGEPTFGFFSLTGPSGSGKNTAIHCTLSRYPRVLTHEIRGGNMTQIVYLDVQCPGNKSMQGMLEQIGRGVDHALGYSSHYFQHMVEKTKGVPQKASRVTELIELFSIGAIVFDEIQLLDFAHTNPSSFNTLLTIQNDTKVAFILVGGEEARAKMAKEEWIFRRMGASITPEECCFDKRQFRKFLKFLFRYHVFDAPIDLTDELVDAFYENTHGIIDYVIQIYSRMNQYYIDRKKKPAVNGEYVAFIAKKYFPALKQLLKEHDYDAIEKLMKDDKHKLDAYLNEPKKTVKTKQDEKRFDALVSEQLLLDNVVENLTDCGCGYNRREIEAAFKRVKKKAGDVPEDKLTNMVALELANAPKPKKAKSASIDTNNIKDMRGAAKDAAGKDKNNAKETAV